MNFKELRENLQKVINSNKKINEMKTGEHEYIAPFFYGFYESMYVDDLDGITYHLFDEPDSVPEDLMSYVTENVEIEDSYYDQVGKEYLDIIDAHMDQYIPAWGKSKFVELDSPKYYNFETDKVVGKIDITEELNNQIIEYLNNNKEAFKQWVKDNHSSYDGFTSFYSNDSDEWMSLEDFDHNELGSIIGFILQNEEGDEIEWQLNEQTLEAFEGPSYTIDLAELNKEFKFVPEIDSLYDIDSYRYNEETDTYEWAEENPDQLKLQFESKMNETWKSFKTFKYRGMVNPKTGEIVYSVLSPKYKNVLSADLKANINDTEDFNNRDIINAAKQVLAQNEARINEISDEVVNKVAAKRLDNAEKAYDKMRNVMDRDKAFKAGKFYPEEKEYAKAMRKKRNNSELLKGHYKKKYGESIEQLTRQLRKFNEDSYGMPDDVVNQVKAAIDKYISEKGNSFEVYVDYRDELDDSTVKEIFESTKPLDAFYEIIGDWDWWENADYEYDYIFENNLELSDEIKEGYKMEVLDMLRDYVSYEIPYNHFDETVGFDVYMHDADSANREYYDMLVFEETDEQDEDGDYIKELSEINGMLTKFLATQGYSAEQFIEYYNANQSGDTFLDSLIQEIENTNHGDGRGCQIAFLVQAPITEMAQIMQEGGTITIPKTAMCGLVESFNGSGGPLEIKLNKDVTGTTRELGKSIYQAGGDFEIYYKDGYSYNIDDIYGLVASAWDTNVIISQVENPKNESLKEASKRFNSTKVGDLIVELPKKMVKDLDLSVYASDIVADNLTEWKQDPKIAKQIAKWSLEDASQVEDYGFTIDGLEKDDIVDFVLIVAAENILKQDEEDFNESLKLNKSKKIREDKESDLSRIADRLEDGFYSGNYPDWGEVDINGTPISELIKTYEVREWVLRQISYPVRDGYDTYVGLDLIFDNYSQYDLIDHTDEDVIADLVALGFDEALIREMPVIEDDSYDGDITDAKHKEIETWIDYDINYVEPEEDDDEEDDEEPEYVEEWQILYKSFDDEDEYFEEDEQGAQDRFEEVKDKVRQFVKKTYKMVDGDWEEDEVEVLYQDFDESLNEISDKTIEKVTRRRRQNLDKAHAATKNLTFADRLNPENRELIDKAINAEIKMRKHYDLAGDRGFNSTDVFEPDSEEYKQLVDFANKVAERIPSAKVEVENTYFDAGQDWEWTTVLITPKGNKRAYQALTPSEQETILLGEPSEIDAVIDRVVKQAQEFTKNEHCIDRNKLQNLRKSICESNNERENLENIWIVQEFINNDAVYDEYTKQGLIDTINLAGEPIGDFEPLSYDATNEEVIKGLKYLGTDAELVRIKSSIYPDVDEKIYKERIGNLINKDGSLKVDKAEKNESEGAENYPENYPISSIYVGKTIRIYLDSEFKDISLDELFKVLELGGTEISKRFWQAIKREKSGNIEIKRRLEDEPELVSFTPNKWEDKNFKFSTKVGVPYSHTFHAYESKINEDKSGYLNDDEIASFYNDFTIESIDNIEKKSSIWNGEENFYYTGDIVIKFPNADVDYDEFSHEETYDNFIAHSEDGTKVAFDRWYPATVYDKLASEVTKAIRAKFPVEEKDIEGIMQVGSKGDKVYRDNKTGKYFIARNGKEHPAYGMTFDNEEDLLMWAEEVGLTESLNREDIKFFEGELLYGYPEGSGRIELGMTVDMVDSICTVGSNDAAVEAVKQDPEIRQQLDEIPEEYLGDLYYALDMDRTEFDALTRDELESYAVWLAAWDIRESEEYACVFESEEK